MFYTPSLIFVVIGYYKSPKSYDMFHLTDGSQTSGNKKPTLSLKYFVSVSSEAMCEHLKVSVCHRG